MRIEYSKMVGGRHPAIRQQKTILKEVKNVLELKTKEVIKDGSRN